MAVLYWCNNLDYAKSKKPEVPLNFVPGPIEQSSPGGQSSPGKQSVPGVQSAFGVQSVYSGQSGPGGIGGEVDGDPFNEAMFNEVAYSLGYNPTALQKVQDHEQFELSQKQQGNPVDNGPKKKVFTQKDVMLKSNQPPVPHESDEDIIVDNGAGVFLPKKGSGKSMFGDDQLNISTGESPASQKLEPPSSLSVTEADWLEDGVSDQIKLKKRFF
jgi:hypothetical protein